MNREQVREAVDRTYKATLRPGYPFNDVLVADLTYAIMALDKPPTAPLLPSIEEIRDAIDPDHGTHPDRKGTVPAEWVGIAAGCVHDMLTERGFNKPPTVTRGQLQAWHTRAPEVPEDEWVMTVKLILEYLGVNVEDNR